MLTDIFNRDGVYQNDGATEKDLSAVKVSAAENLGLALPEDYLRFLRQSNGIQIENVSFEGTDNLIDHNLVVGYSGMIAVGYDGNVVEYLFKGAQKQYFAVSFGHPEEIIASFDNFENLIAYVLTQQGLC